MGKQKKKEKKRGKNLSKRLSQDMRLSASVLEDDVGDAALAALTKVMAEAKTILPLIREEVQLEFINSAAEKDAILRGNCVASRVMSAYANLTGAAWIRKSLKVKITLFFFLIFFPDPEKKGCCETLDAGAYSLGA